MYEVGYHSSEIECPHVALTTDGKRDEIFDLRIYFDGEMGDETNPAYVKSKAALDLMVERANAAIRIHRLLTGTEWNAGTIEDVANIITSTGFVIDPPQ